MPRPKINHTILSGRPGGSPLRIMSTFFEQLLNGLTLGSIYALVALGYTMVYGILLMINFAHSEVFMVGAFVGCGILVLTAALPWPIGIILAL